MRSLVLLLALPLVLAGCDLFESQNCTVADCPPGGRLRVDFVGAPDAPYTLTATAANGEREVIECTIACESSAFFQFSPDRVSIRYESETRSIEYTFEPEYSRYRVNGPDCPPPPCIRGSVQFDLGPEV